MLLEKFYEVFRRMSDFEKDCRGKFTSTRLKNLVTSTDKNSGLLPNIHDLIQEIERITEWS